jgi:hypothetical protein
LNEYTTRNAASAAYNINADLTTGLDGSTYVYDAQNRLAGARLLFDEQLFSSGGEPPQLNLVSRMD